MLKERLFCKKYFKFSMGIFRTESFLLALDFCFWPFSKSPKVVFSYLRLPLSPSLDPFSSVCFLLMKNTIYSSPWLK